MAIAVTTRSPKVVKLARLQHDPKHLGDSYDSVTYGTKAQIVALRFLDR